MRIGLYHESAGERESGGIAVFVRRMAIELSTTHDVVLYTRACTPLAELEDSSVEVGHIPPLRRESALRATVPRVTPLNGQNVSKLLLFYSAYRNGYVDHIDENVDVLLTSQWVDDLLLSNVVEVPTVYEYHGFTNVGVGSRLRRRFSNAEHAVANSYDTARRVQHHFGTPVDGIVYPGVDVERYHPDVEPAFEHDRPIVLFVGRVTEQKGIYDLLDAFAPLAGDARLHVVGRGDTTEPRAHARDLGILGDVVFEGVVPEESLPGYYAAADVYCLPSHYEGLGMGNLEAMATGTAVVTTDVGGVREYATHGETAMVAEPGATDEVGAYLDRLVRSPELRSEIGASGRQVAERFSWPRQAAALSAFCESVVGSDATPVEEGSRANELST